MHRGKISLGHSALRAALHSVCRCQYLCRRTNIKLFRALVLPVLLYDSEIWSIGARERGQLNSFSTRSLHRIMVHRWDNFVSNEIALHETGMSQVTCMIGKRQLRLFGSRGPIQSAG